MVQHYDLLYILPGTLTEDKVPATLQQIHELMTGHGATLVKIDPWGKRKLAYEIKHIRYGFYEAIEFDIESTKLAALESALRLHTAVLRSQITIRKVLTPEQQAATAQLRERIAAHRESAKEKEAADLLKPEVPTAAPVPEPAPTPVQPKQLEEKLEEILESDKVEF